LMPAMSASLSPTEPMRSTAQNPSLVRFPLNVCQ
jgi:hypothetical protein